MEMIRAIAGNVYRDAGLAGGDHDRLQVTRADMQKSRLRRTTAGGADVGIDLPAGAHMRNGDVLECGKKKIIVEQLAEKVLVATLGAGSTEDAVLLGHVIGNMHRPIALSGSSVIFPIQADTEAETFEGIFAGMSGITISIREQVFEPHMRAGVHEH